MNNALRRLYPAPGALFTNVEREFVMKKKLASGIAIFMAALPALAVDEAVVAAVPRVDADPTALIVSAVLFFGMIIGFVIYVFRKGNVGDKDDNR